MIQVHEVTTRYGSTVAVDGLSFEVREGDVTGFLGPNGAGKSTTMRMMVGLDAPTSGRVTIDGRRYADLRFPLHHVGALLEAKAIHPGRSARNHLLWLADSNGIDRRRVDHVLKLVGLTDVAHRRSGGMGPGVTSVLYFRATLEGPRGGTGEETSVASQIDRLATRLGRVEDVLAVHEVIAGYGVTADGGASRSGGLLWTDDCDYDSDAVGADGGYRTRAGIEALIDAAGKAEMGFAHLTQLPVVVVEGDVATAHGASYLPVSPDGVEFKLSRVSANAWDLIRVGDRWQMQRRTSRTVNGSTASKEVFADGARRAAAEREANRGTDHAQDEANGVTVDDTTEDWVEIDRRLRLVEDKLAILQVVAGYGPSVDGGAAAEAGSLWTVDSWYDTDASPAAAVPHGRAGIEGAARRFLDDPNGLAHISHMPLIKVDGDRATVVNHSNTFDQDGDGYRIGRVAANRWDLVRIDGTWQIEHRVNRLLDGSRVAKDLLAEGVRTVLGDGERPTTSANGS